MFVQDYCMLVPGDKEINRIALIFELLVETDIRGRGEELKVWERLY